MPGRTAKSLGGSINTGSSDINLPVREIQQHQAEEIENHLGEGEKILRKEINRYVSGDCSDLPIKQVPARIRYFVQMAREKEPITGTIDKVMWHDLIRTYAVAIVKAKQET